VCSVSRPNYQESMGDEVFNIKSEMNEDVSSTLIRNLLKNKEYEKIKELMSGN
jgi:FAD synthase